MYDVKQEQYTTVIREMIRHENDLTNHRVMWLLVGQGFIFNADVSVQRVDASKDFMLPLVGVLVTLSAFIMLYRSYEARGYLQFLGKRAKRGTLQEEYLPLVGWPRTRIKGWRKDVWVCPWIGKPGDMLEPWLFLPCLFMFMWITYMLQRWTMLETGIAILLAAALSIVSIFFFGIVLVLSQNRDEVLSEQ